MTFLMTSNYYMIGDSDYKYHHQYNNINIIIVIMNAAFITACVIREKMKRRKFTGENNIS